MLGPADGTGGFGYTSQAQRVVFCPAAAADVVAREVTSLGARRILLIASGSVRDRAGQLLAGQPVVAVFDEVRPHVPVDVAQRARARAAAADADLLVCVGGGSTIGTAKAVALTSRLPILAVPTTYSGSEATAVWGLTAGGAKSTGTDPVVVPKVVVYDATLTADLPVGTSLASGLNALAHCIDSLWALDANPVSTTLAMAGARALRHGLPAVRHDAGDPAARQRCLYGAYLGAVAFSAAGSGLHHKICHVLGGSFDLPHAQTHAIVLPHVLAYNLDSGLDSGGGSGGDWVRGVDGLIGASLGSPDAVSGLRDLYVELAAPTALRDVGMREDDIEEAARLVAEAAPPTNPRPVTREAAAVLLRAAWSGAIPT